MQSSNDFLYANPLGEITAFKFDETVVDVFLGMIQRSVPGYSAIISAIGRLVVLNFTLQFIPVADRVRLLAAIRRGLLPGGILILSEKLAFDDARQQALQTDRHHHFKKAHGYSELEVSQKRAALENVLIPETFSIHQQRLTAAAGVSSVGGWFQYFNFASMIALK